MSRRPQDILSNLGPERERNRQLVRRAFEEAGLDPDLGEAWAYQESGFQSRPVSSAGARGLAQFMPATGARYGLKTEDDFFNPEKSARAMAAHARDLLNAGNGDIDYALAAYNAGEGKVRNVLRGRDNFRSETVNYMPSIKAHYDKVKQRQGDPFGRIISLPRTAQPNVTTDAQPQPSEQQQPVAAPESAPVEAPKPAPSVFDMALDPAAYRPDPPRAFPDGTIQSKQQAAGTTPQVTSAAPRNQTLSPFGISAPATPDQGPLTFPDGSIQQPVAATPAPVRQRRRVVVRRVDNKPQGAPAQTGDMLTDAVLGKLNQFAQGLEAADRAGYKPTRSIDLATSPRRIPTLSGGNKGRSMLQPDFRQETLTSRLKSTFKGSRPASLLMPDPVADVVPSHGGVPLKFNPAYPRRAPAQTGDMLTRKLNPFQGMTAVGRSYTRPGASTAGMLSDSDLVEITASKIGSDPELPSGNSYVKSAIENVVNRPLSSEQAFRPDYLNTRQQLQRAANNAPYIEKMRAAAASGDEDARNYLRSHGERLAMDDDTKIGARQSIGQRVGDIARGVVANVDTPQEIASQIGTLVLNPFSGIGQTIDVGRQAAGVLAEEADAGLQRRFNTGIRDIAPGLNDPALYGMGNFARGVLTPAGNMSGLPLQPFQNPYRAMAQTAAQEQAEIERAENAGRDISSKLAMVAGGGGLGNIIRADAIAGVAGRLSPRLGQYLANNPVMAERLADTVRQGVASGILSQPQAGESSDAYLQRLTRSVITGAGGGFLSPVHIGGVGGVVQNIGANIASGAAASALTGEAYDEEQAIQDVIYGGAFGLAARAGRAQEGPAPAPEPRAPGEERARLAENNIVPGRMPIASTPFESTVIPVRLIGRDGQTIDATATTESNGRIRVQGGGFNQSYNPAQFARLQDLGRIQPVEGNVSVDAESATPVAEPVFDRDGQVIEGTTTFKQDQPIRVQKGRFDQTETSIEQVEPEVSPIQQVNRDISTDISTDKQPEVSPIQQVNRDISTDISTDKQPEVSPIQQVNRDISTDIPTDNVTRPVETDPDVEDTRTVVDDIDLDNIDVESIFGRLAAANQPAENPATTPLESSPVPADAPTDAGTQPRVFTGPEKRIIRPVVSRDEWLSMTPDQQREAYEDAARSVRLHELTGIQNRVAYEEAPKKPVQISIDVAGLKLANDTIAPEFGDTLLDTTARILRRHFGEDVFHVKGDEFYAQAGTSEEYAAKMEAIQKELGNAIMAHQGKDGTPRYIQGVEIYHAEGPDIATANQQLNSAKELRKQDQSGRAITKGLVELSAEGGAVPDLFAGRRGIRGSESGNESTESDLTSPVEAPIAEATKPAESVASVEPRPDDATSELQPAKPQPEPIAETSAPKVDDAEPALDPNSVREDMLRRAIGSHYAENAIAQLEKAGVELTPAERKVIEEYKNATAKRKTKEKYVDIDLFNKIVDKVLPPKPEIIFTAPVSYEKDIKPTELGLKTAIEGYGTRNVERAIDARRANDDSFDPLTDAERAVLREYHRLAPSSSSDRYHKPDKWEQAVKNVIRKSNQDVKKAEKAAKPPPRTRAARALQKIADVAREGIDQDAVDAAVERLKNPTNPLKGRKGPGRKNEIGDIGPIAQDLRDLVTLAAYQMRTKTADFAEWSADFIDTLSARVGADYAEKVRPHLTAIHAAGQEVLERSAAKRAATEPPTETRVPETPVETQQEVTSDATTPETQNREGLLTTEAKPEAAPVKEPEQAKLPASQKSAIDPGEFYNRRTMGANLSPEMQAKFDEVVLKTVEEKGLAPKTVRSHQSVKEQAARVLNLDPELLREVIDWKPGDKQPPDEVLLAARNLARSLVHESAALEDQLTKGVDAEGKPLTAGQKLDLENKIEQLDTDAQAIMGSVIPIGSERGRALNSLGIVTGDVLNPEAVIRKVQREAKKRDVNTEAPRYKKQEATLARSVARRNATEKRVQEAEAALQEAGIDTSKLKTTDGKPLSEKEAAREIKRQYKAAPKPKKAPTKLENLQERVAKLEAETKARMEARRKALASGTMLGSNAVLPHLGDYVILAAAKLARKGIDIATWTREMTSEYPETAPYLDKIRAQGFELLRKERLAMNRERDIERVTEGEREKYSDDEINELLNDLETERASNRERQKQLRQETRDPRASQKNIGRVKEIQGAPRGAGHRVSTSHNWRTRVEARGRVAERALSNPDYLKTPEALDDLGRVGAAKLADAEMTRQKWGEEMKAAYGDAYTHNAATVHHLTWKYFHEAKDAAAKQSLEMRATDGQARTMDRASIDALVRGYQEAQKARRDARRMMMESFKSMQRSTKAEIVSATLKAFMLSGFKTGLKNVGSTGIFQGLEETARVPMSLADIVRSAVTKTDRTISGPSLDAMRRSFHEMKTKGWQEAKDVWAHGATAEDLDRLQLREMNSGNEKFDSVVNHVFRLMSAQDKLFRAYAYRRSLEDRAHVRALNAKRKDKSINVKEYARNLADNPTPDMVVDAHADATFAVFQQDNPISTALSRARGDRTGWGNAAMDIPLPFDRTPTNLFLTMLEYSPAGLLKAGKHRLDARKAAKELAGEFFSAADERKFAQSLGRSSVGSAIIALGWMLGAAGRATGPTDDEPSKSERDKTSGRQPMSIKMGGYWHNIGAFSPIANLIAIGAGLQREYAQERIDPGKFAVNMGAIGTKTILEMPMMGAMEDIVSTAKNPGSSGVNLVGGVLSRAVPSIVNDLATMTDSARRDTRGGLFAPTIGRIPGARMMLPERYDGLGRPSEHWRTNAFNPFTPSTAREESDPVDRALRENDVGIAEVKRKPGEAEDRFRRRSIEIGRARYSALRDVLQSSEYTSGSRDARQELLSNAMEKAARTVNKSYK